MPVPVRARSSPSGEEEEEMGVIGLVERMIKDGWEKTKTRVASPCRRSQRVPSLGAHV